MVIGGLMPILTHIGYTVDWKQVTVITWGGLRGAVGLALALVVAQTPEIPMGTIGSKVQCSCAGIHTQLCAHGVGCRATVTCMSVWEYRGMGVWEYRSMGV